MIPNYVSMWMNPAHRDTLYFVASNESFAGAVALAPQYECSCLNL